MKSKRGRGGKQAAVQQASQGEQQEGGVATLLPPGTSPVEGVQSDVLSAIQQFDQHIESDRQVLQKALDTITERQTQADAVYEQRVKELDDAYEQATAENTRQRQQVLERMAMFGVRPAKQPKGVGGGRGKRGARAKRSYKLRQTGAVKGAKVDGRRGRRGEDTEFVLTVLKQMGKGAFANAEIAEAIRQKKPRMERQRIDAALQALRGRVIGGKPQGTPRVQVTGKPRHYRYRVLV